MQAQILEVLRTARDVTGAGVLIITHDLGVVAEFADRALVMYAGRAVETADVDVLYREHPPYAPVVVFDKIKDYAPGYRASWETALGEAPPEILEPNNDAWIGDHCMAAEDVPLDVPLSCFR